MRPVNEQDYDNIELTKDMLDLLANLPTRTSFIAWFDPEGEVSGYTSDNVLLSVEVVADGNQYCIIDEEDGKYRVRRNGAKHGHYARYADALDEVLLMIFNHRIKRLREIHYAV